jgi:hypothetical protein
VPFPFTLVGEGFDGVGEPEEQRGVERLAAVYQNPVEEPCHATKV